MPNLAVTGGERKIFQNPTRVHPFHTHWLNIDVFNPGAGERLLVSCVPIIEQKKQQQTTTTTTK